MLSGLGVALRVMTAPNSAFAQIRDNDGRYFAWSVGVFVLGSLLGSILFAPLDPASEEWEGAVLFAGVNLLTGMIFPAVIYLVGRRFGGNESWRKVFSVIFYTYVLIFPAFVAFVVLTLLAGGFSMWALLAEMGQPDFFESPEAVDRARTLMDVVLGYVGLLGIGAFAFAAWVVVVSVKAVKAVNGFGTAKAFGLIVLALAVSAVAAMPFGM